jgi:capsular exopolysaccharide synthesis family protein
MTATSPDQTLFAPLERIEPLDVLPEQFQDQNIVGFRNADTRARPFKLMRAQIIRQLEARGIKLIGVTSAAPNVGKTFVASNLAAALSRIADYDVYLVDLDLHRPAVASRFAFESEGWGVHDFLTGEQPDMNQIARRINEERLVVVPGYKRDVATGELLTSATGGRLFEGLRALPRSAIVIIDMPPIFADDDAVIIGQHLDGFILVVEDGKTTRRQVQETIRLLSPTPFMGAVLNKYRSQLFVDEYGYGFAYGYGGYY